MVSAVVPAASAAWQLGAAQGWIPFLAEDRGAYRWKRSTGLIERRAVMQSESDLPPIELWWPHLDIPAKQWLVTHLEEALPARIVSEICTVCDVAGLSSDAEFVLSAADRGYIATQVEPVD
jgi:hypothetical protein